MDKLFEYAARSFDVDQSDNANQALRTKVYDLYNSARAASFFVTPYILKLERETLDKWFAEYPDLEYYRRDIENEFRYKPYVLSDDGEKVMAKCSRRWATMIFTAFSKCRPAVWKIRDEEGKATELTESSYIRYMMSQNRRVRRAAFTTYYKPFAQFGNTFATILSGFIKEKTTVSSLRGFPSALHASTFADEVTPSYENLIETVSGHLDVLFDYYDLKRELLNVPHLHMYDMYPPLFGEFDKQCTEACDQVLDAVKIFGAEYYDTLKPALRIRAGWMCIPTGKAQRRPIHQAVTIPSRIFF